MVVEARQTFQAFDDAGLRAPVRLACGKIGNDESNLAQHVHALATYWKLFRAQYPDHEIFDKLTEEQLRLTVPVKETSRWLAFVALKETYANNPEALDEAMDLLADDFLDAMSQGVLLQSHAVLRLAVVAVKGDWPFLIEAGHSERHFRRALEYVTCASERPYVTKFGRDVFGFKTWLDWPEGNWQKGSATTRLLEWMESYLTDDLVAELAEKDQRVPFISVVVRNINAALRLLFRSGAWLEQLDAATVARHGLLALRAYKRCAVLSVEMKEPRLPFFRNLEPQP
ncbi:unnamed protein product [Durusdinium trenchii]|uniref:Uncharacterized protein n=1 Tax=Durusdinium trenchii TaxID=1381693 RepID=A0ABP0NK41_9DINO